MNINDLSKLTFEKDDKLQRKKDAEHLTKFLYDNNDINVISVNSSWGTGKTWFVQMWINFIKNSPEYKDKIIPIYYNAWENDDFDNAFVPLLSEIDSQLFETYSHPELNNIKDAAATIIKTGAFNFVKNATSGLVDLEVGEKELKKKNIYYKHVEKYKERKNARIEFKNALENYTQEFKIPKQIFMFIDELDRCRPTFAIETLERVKHYFDVERFQFVLMLDSTQLSHSIKVLYGNDCDTVGYLRRFVDVEFNMTDPNSIFYFGDIHTDNELIDCIVEISEIFKLTLRDYKKLRLWYKAFITTPGSLSNDVSKDLYYYYAYILLLKLKFPEIFNSFSYSNIILKDTNSLPFNTEIDRLTKKNSNVRVCHMINVIFKRKYGETSQNDESGLTDREKEWLKYENMRYIITNEWKDVKFLSRLT